MSALSPAERRTLRATYASDPEFCSLPCRTRPPRELVVGRVVVELNETAAPRACENFRRLCAGAGPCKSDKRKRLHYANCPVHRVEPGVLIQSGDVVRGDGTGGESVFGRKFKDERGGLRSRHDVPGAVGMASRGRNANTSQFYVTLKPLPELGGKHVVFGKVVEGLSVLTRIGAATGPRPIWISKCGVVGVVSSQ